MRNSVFEYYKKKQKKKKNYFMKKVNRVLSLLIVVTLSLSQAWAERVSRDDAALVANNFMNVASSNSAVKKTPAKKMVMKSVPAQEENQYYVYENENGEGWVIVAANDVITPILAYSETGHFRTDNMPVNVRKWMGKYNNFINKLEQEGVESDEETQAQWKKLRKGANAEKATVIVGPLIKTTWDQDTPYWNLCPGSGNSKAYTGCVATAMAQVMNYWQWPVKGTGSHSYRPKDPNTGKTSTKYSTQSVNFANTTYDWANMKNSYSGSYTDAEATAVATLMFHCGVATEMMYGDYNDGGSGTYTVNYGDDTWGTTTSNDGGCAQNALWYYFGYKKPTGYMRDGYTEDGYQYYKKWSDDDWTAMIKAELDNQHPIMYGGESSEGGHSFICDGYDNQNYFHFNWGWSGENDGYFKLSSLKPGGGGAGGGSYDFSENQDAIIGIVPDKKDLPKVTVTWSVKGVTTTTEFTQEDALVLPEAPADCSESNVFVGWTKSSTVSGDAPKDLFTSATGKYVDEAVTYYAVFAEVDGEGGEAAFDGTHGGTFKIYAQVGDLKYYAKAVVNNHKLQSTTSEAEAGEFVLDAVTGGFTIKNGNNYVTNGSKTNISFSNSPQTWAIEKGTKGSWRVNSTANNGRALVFRASTYNVFGAYSTSNINGTEYFDLEIGSGASISYKNYSLNCSGATAVENVKADEVSNKKVLINGQLFIMHNGAMYNVQGTRVK